jgi:hypothetical protein
MNNQLPPTKEHEQKDDPTKFGEMILNAKMWCAFCLTPEGPKVLKNTTGNDAYLLVAQFLIDNREVRETMFAFVKEKTKFEI